MEVLLVKGIRKEPAKAGSLTGERGSTFSTIRSVVVILGEQR